MNFVENIRVGKEGAKTGFGTEQDRSSVIFGAWEVGGIGITEDTSTQGDELVRVRFSFYCHVSCSIA